MKTRKPLFFDVLFAFLVLASCQQAPLKKADFYQEKNWVVEKQSDSTQVKFSAHEIEIKARKGITLWYDSMLKSPVHISYQAMVVDSGGTYDRLSDLNCFWMASDPLHADSLFARADWRNGDFGKYYSLRLYYVGYGGNHNTTTRFRRYDGDYASFRDQKKRPAVWSEYTDPRHLLTPNKWYRIELVADQGCMSYTVDGETLFDYQDEEPYVKGYFGIRTVDSRLRIKEMKISN